MCHIQRSAIRNKIPATNQRTNQSADQPVSHPDNQPTSYVDVVWLSLRPSAVYILIEEKTYTLPSSYLLFPVLYKQPIRDQDNFFELEDTHVHIASDEVDDKSWVVTHGSMSGVKASGQRTHWNDCEALVWAMHSTIWNETSQASSQASRWPARNSGSTHKGFRMTSTVPTGQRYAVHILYFSRFALTSHQSIRPLRYVLRQIK